MNVQQRRFSSEDMDELILSNPNISLLCKSWCIMKMRGIDDPVVRQALQDPQFIHRPWNEPFRWGQWAYKRMYGYDKGRFTHEEYSKMWIECLKFWHNELFFNEYYHVRTVSFQEGLFEVHRSFGFSSYVCCFNVDMPCAS